ncbi:unnamed protein product, partial [Bubo scandiacus]
VTSMWFSTCYETRCPHPIGRWTFPFKFLYPLVEFLSTESFPRRREGRRATK